MSLTSPLKTPHLILGMARSGKSLYAERLIGTLAPPYTYIATAQVLDDEMHERVRLHRERRSSSWQTIESPFDLPRCLARLKGQNRPVLVDCLTLWLSNILIAPSPPTPPEEAIDALCASLSAADHPLFLVSTEVGGGIVPENPLARRFRDVAGTAHQRIAAVCSSVTLVVAGLPLSLKSTTKA